MVAFDAGRLKALREAHAMNADAAAKLIGKSTQQWYIWEQGVNNPSLDNLLLICNKFDVDVSFFFDIVSTPVEEAVHT